MSLRKLYKNFKPFAHFNINEQVDVCDNECSWFTGTVLSQDEETVKVSLEKDGSVVELSFCLQHGVYAEDKNDDNSYHARIIIDEEEERSILKNVVINYIKSHDISAYYKPEFNAPFSKMFVVNGAFNDCTKQISDPENNIDFFDDLVNEILMQRRNSYIEELNREHEWKLRQQEKIKKARVAAMNLGVIFTVVDKTYIFAGLVQQHYFEQHNFKRSASRAQEHFGDIGKISDRATYKFTNLRTKEQLALYKGSVGDFKVSEVTCSEIYTLSSATKNSDSEFNQVVEWLDSGDRVHLVVDNQTPHSPEKQLHMMKMAENAMKDKYYGIKSEYEAAVKTLAKLNSVTDENMECAISLNESLVGEDSCWLCFDKVDKCFRTYQSTSMFNEEKCLVVGTFNIGGKGFEYCTRLDVQQYINLR